MKFVELDALLSVLLFVAIVGTRELGRQIGRRAAYWEDPKEGGTGAIEGAVFGLYGLLVAFTFGSALSRFEERQKLILDEASAIDSAWDLIDVLPDEDQPPLRARLRRYLDARIRAHEAVPDWDEMARAFKEAETLSREMWTAVVASVRKMGALPTGAAVLKGFDEVGDVELERKVATDRHQPVMIFALLVVFALASALVSGYASSQRARRTWFHGLLLAAVSAIAFYVIIDLEHPRRGLIRLGSADRVLHDVRESMGR